MRVSAAGAMVVVGFVLACGGAAQTEEEALQRVCDAVATCADCPDPTEEGYLEALMAHVRPDITHQPTSEVLAVLTSASLEDAIAIWAEASGGRGEACALTPVLDQRLAAHRAVQVAKLCALHTSCDTFDGTDPESVVACAEQRLDPAVAAEVKRMDTRSSIGLSKSLVAYSSMHTTAGCALSIVLRDAR